MDLNIFWFRRDLRLQDNAALYHALKSENPVIPVFIFDSNILDQLENKKDRRVEFIHATLEKIQQQLTALGSTLEVYHGTPENIFCALIKKYTVKKVFANHDYEVYGRERDKHIEQLLSSSGASLHTYKDQVIFEKDEVIKDDRKPYTVFTPYSRKWKAVLNDFYLKPYPVEKYFSNFFKQTPVEIPSMKSIGFENSGRPFPSNEINEELIKKYAAQRDFPALAGTSRLGIHLRFGTTSIRKVAKEAQQLNEKFLNELIWRDFYHMITWHFPEVGKGRAFKKEYDHIEWHVDNGEFEKWCTGQTGYPIVDAGMRELNATGFMHNRVRMITASFLAKHLLLDWRLGEAYFAEKLLDYDFASNNGGWQWAAGSGCDAAPYFRIFNPRLQTEKFDKQLKYIRQWVPELDSFDYPAPIVDHDFARKRCLAVYSKALKKNAAG
ncbi:MAG: deoxyribodipyrimidine photo-lyase [Ferruginibacter sp.]